MSRKKDFKWDGRSRPADDTYRENFNEIFKVKELPKVDQKEIVKSITQTSLNRKYGDLVENIIQKKLAEKKNDD